MNETTGAVLLVGGALIVCAIFVIAYLSDILKTLQEIQRRPRSTDF